MNRRTSRKSLPLDNVAFLAIIGILAGALGGLGVGLVTGRAPASAATSTSK
jgi:hypothetical protein